MFFAGNSATLVDKGVMPCYNRIMVCNKFVIFRIDNKTIGISARSYGKMNVQVVMEALGGGGHLTMAACQLEVENQEIAENMLIAKIKELRKKGILK